MSAESGKPGLLLTVNIQHRVGVLSVAANFALAKPWTVLFGPSGSGKTTILRAIAGFVRPDSGRIARETSLLVDRATGVFVPAHLRPIRSAAQTARLFPHLTILGNIRTGGRWSSKPKDEKDLAYDLMERFRLDKLADRMPAYLSGGERQRASVARALFSATTSDGPIKPWLLLDEPFAGLDAPTRDDLLAQLQSWVTRWKIPVLSVTHDIGEAFQLQAEVIKIVDGKITAQGPATEVLAEDRQRLLNQLKP